nr:histidinol-phosphate transaminase [Sphingomonas sp. Y57]
MTLKNSPYVPGRRVDEVREETGLAVISKLASNENPLGPSPLAVAVMRTALNDVAEYPDMVAGQAREAIAKHLSVSPEEVILGAGSDEILMLASCAALGPGRSAIVLDPTFPQYRQHSLARGANVLSVPVGDLDDSIDGIVNLTGEGTGVVWLANPNNPTGTVIPNARLRDLAGRLGPDWLLVVDEAYVDFRSDEPDGAVELIREYANVLVTRTFSKIYGLAGIRVGFGIGARDLIARLGFFRGPFNTSQLAQKAVIAALDDSEHYERSRSVNSEGRARLLDFCTKHSLRHYASEASFILLEPPMEEMECVSSLERRGYIVRPGRHLGAPGMIRITIGTPEQMDGLIETLETLWNLPS